MKLVMKVNLGSRDAAPCGLDFKKAMEGMTVDVSDDIGEKMIAKGWALPESIKGDPKQPKMKGK